MDTQRRSDRYAIVQTVLLAVFSLTFCFDRSAPWFENGWSRSLGTLVCALGLLLLIAGMIALRRVIQIAPSPRADGHLVTDGIYRWFRHPIYTAIVILDVGLFLRKPTPAVAIGAAAVIAFLIVKSRFEEALLAERYAGYAAYRSTTWGVLPGVK